MDGRYNKNTYRKVNQNRERKVKDKRWVSVPKIHVIIIKE